MFCSFVIDFKFIIEEVNKEINKLNKEIIKSVIFFFRFVFLNLLKYWQDYFLIKLDFLEVNYCLEWKDIDGKNNSLSRNEKNIFLRIYYINIGIKILFNRMM